MSLLNIHLVEYTAKSIAVYGDDLALLAPKLTLLGGNKRNLPRLKSNLTGFIFPNYKRTQIEDILKSINDPLRNIAIYYRAKFYNKIKECLQNTASHLNLSYEEVLKIIYSQIFIQTPQARMVVEIHPEKYYIKVIGYFNDKDLQVLKELNAKASKTEMSTQAWSSYTLSLSQYKRLESYLLTGNDKLYTEPSWRKTKKEKIYSIKDCENRFWSILTSLKNLKGENIIQELENYMDSECQMLFLNIITYINPTLDYSDKLGLFYFFLADIKKQTQHSNNITFWTQITPYANVTYVQSYNSEYSDSIYAQKLKETSMVDSVTSEIYQGYGLNGMNIYTIEVMRGTIGT